MTKTFLFVGLLGVALTACNKEQGPAAKSEAKVELKTVAEAKPEPKPAEAAKPAKTKKPGESAATRDHVDEDGVVRRGEKLTARERLSVALTMAKLSEVEGELVKVSGTVGKVCESKGCWFVLEEGEQKIRITAKDYRFFVPQNSVGMLATVEGTLTVKELSKEDADHLAKEGAPVTAAQKEITIAAVGIELKKKAG